MSGKNIDLYVGISISLVMSLLGIFGVTSLSIVTAVILLMLFLITVNILRERWFREELLSKLFPQVTWSNIESDMVTKLRRAHTLRFIGISPLRIIRKYEIELLDILCRKGGEICFIVVNPKNRAMNSIRKGRPENFSDGILFLKEVCRLFAAYIKSGHLKIKLIDYVPSHIMTLTDDGGQNGTIFTTVYSFRQVDPHRPSQIITRREGLSYSYFQQEFESLWDSGESYFPFDKEGDQGGTTS